MVTNPIDAPQIRMSGHVFGINKVHWYILSVINYASPCSLKTAFLGPTGSFWKVPWQQRSLGRGICVQTSPQTASFDPQCPLRVSQLPATNQRWGWVVCFFFSACNPEEKPISSSFQVYKWQNHRARKLMETGSCVLDLSLFFPGAIFLCHDTLSLHAQHPSRFDQVAR